MNDNKITIAELDKEMNDRIIRNVKYMFKVRKEVGKSLNDLGTYCEEKYNISVNTGNLSSLLNKKRNGNIQLALLYYICEYLNVDMQEMMWKGMDEVSKVFSEFSVTTDKFIIAARDMKKYLGRYFCYFYAPEKPSRHDNDGKILTGTLELEEGNEEWGGDLCNATLSIDTGLKEKETGARAEKKYYGQMIVSRKLSIAYVVLTDRRLGELMFISFPYNQQLNHKDNIGSIAFVCGCSSNENSKMPVVYRMLFTRIDLNENDELDKLKANLLMNTSIIRIEKDKLDHLLNEWGDGDVIKRLMNQIMELDLGIELKEFYEITEHSIRQINEKKLKDMTKDELILQIREEATADKYNKISGSLAERIVNALLKIQKEREE